MAFLQCSIDEDTLRILRIAADRVGRPVEELAENAIAEAALDYQKKNPVSVRQYQGSRP